MNYIKEYCEQFKLCVIRTKTHACDFEHFENMFNIAKSDFSDLEKSQVRIIHFGGICYNGTFGIEFTINSIVSEEYKRHDELEYLL